MSYAGRCLLPERLGTFGAFNVIEHPITGAIFTTDQNHALQCSTDDGRTWFQPPGSAGVLIRTDSMNINALGEILLGEIAASPRVFLVSADGSSFTAATPSPMPSASLAVTRFARGAGAVVYAINDNSAVFHKSTDHGHTWTSLTGQPVGQAYAIEVNRYGVMIGGEINSLYCTTDDGANWTDWGLQHLSIPAPTDYHGNLWNVVTSPYSGTTFATIGDPAGQGTGAIQRHLATDGVGVWNHCSGLNGSGGEQFSTFVFQPDGSILASAILSTPGLGEIFKSTNDGASWTEISRSVGRVFVGLVRLHVGLKTGRLYMTDNAVIIRKNTPGGY